MSEIEQDLILFFKLYLLARKRLYIDYMKGARTLVKWFDWSKASNIDYYQSASIFCGGCFRKHGECERGAFMLCCGCNAVNNFPYEIQQLCSITGIKWNLCVYLLVRAIEDIYKGNNADFLYPLFIR